MRKTRQILISVVAAILSALGWVVPVLADGIPPFP
jgi:hypothetical protein